MESRAAQGCVLLVAGVAGLFFAPVFGILGLLPSILAVLVVCAAATELCRRFAALAPWRPVLALLAGLLVIAEVELSGTTIAGVPTGATVRGLVGGITQSWQLTLQSTWPARPDAELLLFVPIAVLVAAVLGLELLRWPAAALIPSLLVLGVSQAYVAMTGFGAALGGLLYAAVAAALLAVTRQRSGAPSGRRRQASRVRRRLAALAVGLPVLVFGVAAAILVTAADSGHRPSYSLHQNAAVPLPPQRLTNPLDDVAARLRDPGLPVFSYTGGHGDLWRLVVLDNFNGVTWSADPQYRRMGTTTRPAAGLTVPTAGYSAQVSITGAVPSPWLPSQQLLSSVDGVAPLIDQSTGTLLVPGRADALEYTVSWREPQVGAEQLGDAPIDTTATGTGGVGVVPPGIADLARTAVGGIRPSFRTALVLERYLKTHYQLAQGGPGADLPTGSGWPQLRDFLLESHRGTSEQFAAGYVALAKTLGIPARLAVGFRAPAAQPDGRVVVRNGDVFAWPEVAVAGVGWVPVDPTPASAVPGGHAAPQQGLAAATDKARASLPPQQQLQDPPLPPPPPPRSAASSPNWLNLPVPALPTLLAVLAVIVLALLGIPLYTTVRGLRRRRCTGAAGVLAAWYEARDRLRAHGVVWTSGMTVRDTALAARVLDDQSIVDALYSLARMVDYALWSGQAPPEHAVANAWVAVAAVRRGLSRRRMGARIRAMFHLTALHSPAVGGPVTA